MATASSRATTVTLLLVTLTASLIPSSLADCQYTGWLPGTSGGCDTNNSPDCCVDGQQYQRWFCSPGVTAPATWAALTVNSFRKGEDGGSALECDNAYHEDSEFVVALSTGWYSGGSRCGHYIKITAKTGAYVYATVVDECDSVNGCDAEHNFERPCGYNVVDASPAVWNALGLNQDVGLEDVTWSDA